MEFGRTRATYFSHIDFRLLATCGLFVMFGSGSYAASATVRPAEAQETQSQRRMDWDTYRHGTVDEVRAALAELEDSSALTEWTSGWPPLFRAAVDNPDPAVLLILRDKGANLAARSTAGRSLLHFAALNPNPEVLRCALGFGFEIDDRDAYGGTPLIAAVSLGGGLEQVRILLDAGADPNAKRTKDNANALLTLMSSLGDLRTAKALIDAGADIDARGGPFFETPLMIAAGNHPDPMACRILLEAGANLEARGNVGMTPLHYAAANNHPGVVKALLDAGARIDATADHGEDALYLAAHSAESVHTVDLLIRAGAPLNRRYFPDRRTALMAAVSKNRGRDSGSIISRLILGGADVLARSGSGYDALMHGLQAELGVGPVRVLLNLGSDPNLAANGYTALGIAVYGGASLEVIEALLAADAEPNLDTARVTPPLMLEAAKGRRPEVIAALLEAGADPDIRLPDGGTPLAAALSSPTAAEVVRLLLEAGANPNVRMAGGQPALMSALAVMPKMARPMVDAGADVNVVVQGMPLLTYMIAAKAPAQAIVQLLALGADVNRTNDGGQATALLLACSLAEDPAIVTALLDAGADTTQRVQGRTALELARDNPALAGSDVIRALEPELEE